MEENYFEAKAKRECWHDPMGVTIKHPMERFFAREFFDHQNWMYEPATFRTSVGKYTPDYYDKERDMFIEYSSTVSAYLKNKAKYHKFIEEWPQFKFEVRTGRGKLVDIFAPEEDQFEAIEREIEMSKRIVNNIKIAMTVAGKSVNDVVSETTFSARKLRARLNGKVDFTVCEVEELCTCLSFPVGKVMGDYMGDILNGTTTLIEGAEGYAKEAKGES